MEKIKEKVEQIKNEVGIKEAILVYIKERWIRREEFGMLNKTDIFRDLDISYTTTLQYIKQLEGEGKIEVTKIGNQDILKPKNENQY